MLSPARHSGLHDNGPDLGGAVCRVRPLSRAALCALALITAVIAALVPVSVTHGNFVKSEARANPIVTNLGGSLLTDYAAAAGLSNSEFVATLAGIVTVATGMELAQGMGMSMDGTLADNLSGLINVADYPDWNELDSDKQSLYGTKQNYDSVKFNELLNLFGFSDVSQEYYGSGGANFNPSDDLREKLVQIGDVGKRWKKRVGVQAQELRDWLLPDYANDLYKYLYGGELGGEAKFDATGLEGWPSEYPLVLNVGVSDSAWIHFQGSSSLMYYKFKGSAPVYNVILRNGYFLTVNSFSKEPFQYGESTSARADFEPTVNRNSYSSSESLGSVYYAQGSIGTSAVQGTNPVYSNVASGNVMSPQVMAMVLYGELESPELVPDVPGYVPEYQGPVYFPEQGLIPVNNWYSFTDLQRPVNPYNPDDQTSTPEWRQETKQNLTPLLGVHLERLFPFCLVYDMQLLWDKFSGSLYDEGGGLRTQAVEDYTKIVIPVAYDASIIGVNIDEEITIDLVPLRDLLQITKPFVFFLLMFALIAAIVNFWKRILTGA